MKNKNLGKTGKDMITGFSGTIIGFVEYFTGCSQYLITPKCKKGEEEKKPDAYWFDDNRIEISEPKKKINLLGGKPDGCDIAAPTK